ncbi:MAG: hypothetical protein ABUS54_00685 [Actinomycetota bacterium]
MSALADRLHAELDEDKAFLRQLRPELIKKRLRGAAPTDSDPAEERHAPSGPQLGPRAARPSAGGGPSLFVVLGVALVAGVALAKWLDWRGHAHPRR